MSTTPPTQSPLRLAFIGMPGAGKTTLLIRYLDYIEQDLLGDLVAIGNDADYLIKLQESFKENFKVGNYVGSLAEHAGSRFDSDFLLNLCKDKTPRSLLQIEWMDYPGYFWSDSQNLPSKKITDRLEKICSAQVIFLLIDAGEWIRLGASYLAGILNEFSSAVRRITKESEQTRSTTNVSPLRFVIALAKSDRMRWVEKDFSAKAFRDKLQAEAAPQLQNLRDAIKANQQKDQPQAYLLLSICQADEKGEKISDLAHTGLDAIAPLALLPWLRELPELGDGSTTKEAGAAGLGLGTIGMGGAGIAGSAAAFAWPLFAAGAIVFLLGAAAGLAGDRQKGLYDDRQNLKKALDEAQTRLRASKYYWDEAC